MVRQDAGGADDQENCVSHLPSLVPVPGRDIITQAWYQAGVSVIDFTDSANPKEIGYYDRGPISGTGLVLGGLWSSYYYNGRIFGSEIARGFDVWNLTPTAPAVDGQDRGRVRGAVRPAHPAAPDAVHDPAELRRRPLVPRPARAGRAVDNKTLDQIDKFIDRAEDSPTPATSRPPLRHSSTRSRTSCPSRSTTRSGPRSTRSRTNSDSAGQPAAPLLPGRLRDTPGVTLLADVVAASEEVAATSARSQKIAALAELLRRLDAGRGADRRRLPLRRAAAGPRRRRLRDHLRDRGRAGGRAVAHGRRPRRGDRRGPGAQPGAGRPARGARSSPPARPRHGRRGGLRPPPVHGRAAAGRARRADGRRDREGGRGAGRRRRAAR